MAENTEVDGRVDLDDNYLEEEDDDVEEHLEEDGVDDGGGKMMKKNKGSGESKGYAFVAFKSKEVAQKEIEELHSKEYRGWNEDEFRKVIDGVGPEVENIELIKDPQNTSRNRGFAFILYYNNACADYSRQKMFGFEVCITCYIIAFFPKNVLTNLTGGQVLEVVLAEPHTDKKTDATYPYSAGLHPNHLLHPEYSGLTRLHMVLMHNYAHEQPVIYGSEPMPTGMAMAPMALPYDRIGYVLQQPEVQIPTPRPRRADRSNGPGGSVGRGGSSSGDDGNHSRRYRNKRNCSWMTGYGDKKITNSLNSLVSFILTF
ncbi:hypothetical protein PTKIN_Ptkin12aG0161700 [Pterospermum kingtungense]